VGTPLEDVGDRAWTGLARGADDPAHPLHLLTLATVSVDGRPSARLMVNRGADGERGLVWFHTDAASPKTSELRANPWACVVGWDGASGVELRLAGSVALRTDDAVADRHWEQWSRQALWVYEQGTASGAPGAQPDLRLPRDREQIAHRLTARSRAGFVVVEVRVETVDWLEVEAGGSVQRRAVMRRSEGWEARWV
jgi:general stress protein 26